MRTVLRHSLRNRVLCNGLRNQYTLEITKFVCFVPCFVLVDRAPVPHSKGKTVSPVFLGKCKNDRSDPSEHFMIFAVDTIQSQSHLFVDAKFHEHMGCDPACFIILRISKKRKIDVSIAFATRPCPRCRQRGKGRHEQKDENISHSAKETCLI